MVGYFKKMRWHRFKMPFEGIGFIILLMMSSTCMGVIGYMTIEDFTFLNALYLSVITLSTIGYETVKPLSDNGKIFSVVYILVNIVFFTYSVTILSRYFLDGKFKQSLNIFFMHEKINKLKGHVIVCGGGRNGMQAVQILQNNKIQTVLVEINEEKVKEAQKYVEYIVHGDSTKDENLTNANIENAHSIIVAMQNDADNLFTVLSARQLNPNIKIISRASSEATRHKLKLAGADNVILPEHLGGTYMATLVYASDIKEFLDELTISNNDTFQIIEIEIQTKQSLKELNAWQLTGANIIGLKNENNTFVLNPAPNLVLDPSQKIIAMGSQEQLSKLKDLLRS